jgi:hypothetical protein
MFFFGNSNRVLQTTAVSLSLVSLSNDSLRLQLGGQRHEIDITGFGYGTTYSSENWTFSSVSSTRLSGTRDYLAASLWTATGSDSFFLERPMPPYVCTTVTSPPTPLPPPAPAVLTLPTLQQSALTDHPSNTPVKTSIPIIAHVGSTQSISDTPAIVVDVDGSIVGAAVGASFCVAISGFVAFVVFHRKRSLLNNGKQGVVPGSNARATVENSNQNHHQSSSRAFGDVDIYNTMTPTDRQGSVRMAAARAASERYQQSGRINDFTTSGPYAVLSPAESKV